MGIFLSVLLGSIGFILIVTGLFLLKQTFHCYRTYSIFKKLGIPGPEPRLFIGNFWQLKKREDSNEVLEDWIKQYGNVFGYYLGTIPHLVVNDVDIIHEIMVRQNKNFQNRLSAIILLNIMLKSIIFAEGDEWKAQRRIVSPAFSPSKLRLLQDSMNSSVSIFLEEIAKRVRNGTSFDIYERARGLTLDVISKCALAMDTDCQSDPDSKFLNTLKAFFDMALSPAVEAGIMFPPLMTVFAFINNYFTSGRMTDTILANTRKIIGLRRKEGTRRTDLLQIMLDSADEDKNSGGTSKYHMDDYSAMANAYVFLLAGYETTSTALGFTFYLLAKHQDIQQRLYEEISQHVQDDTEITYNTLFEMQYLDQVLNESLRLYPPVTLFMTRVCEEDCEIYGQFIPKGMVVQAPVWHIHHDPAHYPDPSKYDPERFSPENKDKIHPAAFMPFGIGPRNCIGMRFALQEAKLAIARVIKMFHLSATEDTEDPLILTCPTVVSYPKNGVIVKASFRSETR